MKLPSKKAGKRRSKKAERRKAAENITNRFIEQIADYSFEGTDLAWNVNVIQDVIKAVKKVLVSRRIVRNERFYMTPDEFYS